MAIKDSDLLYVHNGSSLRKITWEMLWKKQIPGTCKLVIERKVGGTWKQYSITAQEFWDESPKLSYAEDYYMAERNQNLKHTKLRMKRERPPIIEDRNSGSRTDAYAEGEVYIAQDGELDPPGTNLRRQWQISNNSSWSNINGATGVTYTPGWDQLRKKLRLKWTEKGANNVDVIYYSNTLNITIKELAAEAIYFTYTTGTAFIQLSDSPYYELYQWKDGRWQVFANVTSTYRTQLRVGHVYGMVAGNSLRGFRFGDRDSSGDTWSGDLSVSRWTTGDIRLLESSCMARITNAADMFVGCDKFNQDLSWWDMSNVKNFEYFLSWCHSFNQSVSRWNWSGAHLMQHAFAHCKKFNHPVNNMQIGSKVDVHDASSFFHGCHAFNQDVDKMKISSAYSLSYFLYNCVNFNKKVGNWYFDADVLVNPMYSHRTSLTGFFSKCAKFNQPVRWNTSKVISFQQMFSGCTVFNQAVPFNTALAESLRYMFSTCEKFNQPIDFNTSQVTNFQYMFLRAYAFNYNIGHWDVSRGRDFSSFFGTNTSVRFNHDLSSWNVSNATSYDSFIYRSYPPEKLPPFGQ
jgi:hypothetical protein